VASFLGQHRYQMDAKGRIALPSRFHDAFGKSMFLILGRDAGLWAYAEEDWHRITDRIDSSPTSTRELRFGARTLFCYAVRLNVYGLCRVVITQFLR
jgi:MraZ protein